MQRTKPTIEERRELLRRVVAGEWPFSECIRRLRKQFNITQPEFAKLVGVCPRVLMDIENGKGNPTLATLDRPRSRDSSPAAA